MLKIGDRVKLRQDKKRVGTIVEFMAFDGRGKVRHWPMPVVAATGNGMGTGFWAKVQWDDNRTMWHCDIDEIEPC